jgi:hypothetical protein
MHARAALFVSVSLLCACALEQRHNVRPAAGYVPDGTTAVRIAQAVWTPIYDARELREQRPFVATLRGDVWHVQGTINPPHLDIPGGVAVAEIHRVTGKILRISHGE